VPSGAKIAGVPFTPSCWPSAYCIATGRAVPGRHAATALGVGQGLATIRCTPDRDHVGVVLAAQAHARERQVLDGDAVAVELGDVLVQLAAVTTLDVGEHADGVLGVRRGKHDAIAVVGLGQQAAAVTKQALAVGRALARVS
jgi:hypothetical protein